MLSDSLIFFENEYLSIGSSEMAFKIPTTIEGKKLFSVFDSKVYKQSLLIHEYWPKLKCIEVWFLSSLSTNIVWRRYVIDDQWTMIVFFLFMHSLFTYGNFVVAKSYFSPTTN